MKVASIARWGLVIAGAAALAAVAAIVLWPGPKEVALPAGAFLVSVRACDVETAQVLPFRVTTDQAGTNVPIQAVALRHFTLSTFCQWTDWTTRTVRVEAAGYEPRDYTVRGKREIIAVLYARE